MTPLHTTHYKSSSHGDGTGRYDIRILLKKPVATLGFLNIKREEEEIVVKNITNLSFLCHRQIPSLQVQIKYVIVIQLFKVKLSNKM